MSWFTSAAQARSDDEFSGRGVSDLLWILSFAMILLALLAEGIMFWIRIEHYSAVADALFAAAAVLLLGLGWLLIRSFRGYVWYRLVLAVLLFGCVGLQTHLVYNIGQSPYVQTYSRTTRAFESVPAMRFFAKEKEIIILADRGWINTEIVVAEDFRSSLYVELDSAASLAVMKARLDAVASVSLRDYPWIYRDVADVFEVDLKAVVETVSCKWGAASREVEAPGLSKEFAREVRLGLEERGWKFDRFEAERFKRHW